MIKSTLSNQQAAKVIVTFFYLFQVCNYGSVWMLQKIAGYSMDCYYVQRKKQQFGS